MIQNIIITNGVQTASCGILGTPKFPYNIDNISFHEIPGYGLNDFSDDARGYLIDADQRVWVKLKENTPFRETTMEELTAYQLESVRKMMSSPKKASNYPKASVYISEPEVSFTISGTYSGKDVPNIFEFADDNGCAKDLREWLKSNNIKYRDQKVGDSYSFTVNARSAVGVRQWFYDNEVKTQS